MPDQPSPEDRTAAAIAACLAESARGRARTAQHLRLSGPGAAEELILLVLTTVVFGFGFAVLV